MSVVSSIYPSRITFSSRPKGGSGPTLIVDTMTAWDGERIEEALANKNVSCDAVDFVVCTHGHSDHIGCNYLFRNAKHIVGQSISKGDSYELHDFVKDGDYALDAAGKLRVTATPGHTSDSVSLVSGLVEISTFIKLNENMFRLLRIPITELWLSRATPSSARKTLRTPRFGGTWPARRIRRSSS